MKQLLVGILLLASVGLAAWQESDVKQFLHAISAVLAGSLPDSTAVADRLGNEHQLWADSKGLWYKTSEPVSFRSIGHAPAIRLTKERVSSPALLLVTDNAGAYPTKKLVVLWRIAEPDGPHVLFCTRRLDQRFCVWSEPVDVTPSSSRRY